MSDRNLKLALQITADLNKAKRDIEGMTSSLQGARQAANALGNTDAGSRITTTANQAAEAVRDLDAATDLTGGVQQFDDYAGVVESTTEILASATEQAEALHVSADQVLPSLAQLAATLGGIAAGISLVDAIDEWGQYDERVRMAAKSEADYVLVKQRLLDTANNTYRPLAEAQELYIKTSSALRDLGYTTSEQLDITDSFSYLLVTNAASAEAGASALDAYSDAIQTNKVEVDGWKSILSAMPTVVKAISDATGKSEDQIRQLGINGELSLQDLNEGFRKTVAANKEVAAGMDATRKDSVTKLTNEFVNLLGEFNKTWQITPALSGGIAIIADNIKLVTTVTAALLTYGLTKYLVSAAIAAGQNAIAIYQQLTATSAAIQLERVRTASLLVLADVNLAAATTELRNAHAEEIAAVTAAQLTAARIRVAQATLAHGEATAAQTLAQNANNAANAGSALTMKALGATLLGPTGIAIAVATVATGFLLLSGNSDEASDSLDEQSKSVADLAAEYLKLDETQRRVAIREQLEKVDQLTEAYQDQRAELVSLREEMLLAAQGADKLKLQQLYDDYQKGKISANQFATEINKLTSISDIYKSAIDGSAQATQQKAEKLQRANQILEIYTGKTDAAKIAANGQSSALDAVGKSAGNAATGLKSVNEELKKYIEQSKQNIFSNTMQRLLIDKGYSSEQAKALEDAWKAKQSEADPKNRQLTAADAKLALTGVQAASARAEAEAKQTKEKEKQKKLAEQTAAINDRVLAQSKKYDYAGLEAQYKLPAGILSAVSMQESRGNPNAKSPKGALGAFQFMPATANQYDLKDRTDVKASAVAAAKYLAYLLNLFKGDLDKAIMAYNAGEGNVQTGKAYSFKETQGYLTNVQKYRAGANGLNVENAQQILADMDKARADTNEAARAAAKERSDNQLEIRKQLFTEDEKREYDHQQNLIAINKAGFSEYEKNQLTARENIRYETEKQIKLEETLKRIQEAMPGLQNDLLIAQGNELQAQLAAVDAKWQPLKNDLAEAAAKTENPFQRAQFYKAQLDVELVIDKEKLQLQLNDVTQRLQDMQSLRSARLDNLNTEFQSGQITQYQFAEQAQAIDNELKPAMQELVDLATQYAEKMGGADGAQAVENIKAIGASLASSNNEFKKFLPTADQLNERIAGGLTDAIMNFADGTMSAGKAFKQFASSFLKEIAQMIIKQMVFNAIGGASAGGGTGGAIATGLSAAFSAFSEGGYTGPGAREDFAGIVHGGEVVINKAMVDQPGAKEFLLDFNQRGFDALNKYKGYADGGLVTPSVQPRIVSPAQYADPAAQIAQSTSFTANQQFLLLDDPSRLSDYIKSSQGQETLVVMMSRDPAKFRSALKVGG